MQIDKALIKDLNMATYNPRVDLKPGDAEFEKLKRSIEHFGYIDPIIVNKRNMVVVGGHQRLKVLKELGYTDIDVVYVDLNDTEEKALNIALNKISGDWDAEKLEDLLRDISLDTDFDLELTGFDLPEVDTLFSGALKSLDEATSDKKESTSLGDDNFDVEKAEKDAENNKRNIKTGDIWALGQHILVCNDSTVKQNVVDLINNRVVDVLLTDPPYEQNMKNDEWSGYNYLNKLHKNLSEESALKNKKTMEDITELSFFDLSPLAFYKELPVGSMYIFNNAYGVRTLLKIFDDYKFRILVWYKTDPTPFLHDQFRADTEYCLYLHNKNRAKRVWNNKLQPTSIYNGVYTSTKGAGVQDNKETGGKVHPTMKPLELIGNYIQISSNPGGFVLDPFGGSGTTLIACEKLGRRCLMMEKEPKYMNVIIDRFEAVTGQKAHKIESYDIDGGDINA